MRGYRVLVAEEVADDDVGVVGGDGFVGLQARVKVVVLVGRNVAREIDLQCVGVCQASGGR